MSLSELKTADALDAAQALIKATAATVVSEAATHLLARMQLAPTYRERGHLAFAQNHLLKCQEPLLVAFGTALGDKVRAELSPRAQQESTASKAGETDWGAISLVDEDQIEDRMSFERIGQYISHECDAELRDLSSYMSALLRHGRADPERNPLRGNALGWALHQAIERVTEDPQTQKIFATELGQIMAREMRPCYISIIADLKLRGVRPAELAVRPNSGAARPGGRGVAVSEEAVKNWERSLYGRLVMDAGDDPRRWETSIGGRMPAGDAGGGESDPESSSALLDRLMRGGMPNWMGIGSTMSRTPALVQADVEMTSLMRRLNSTDVGVGGAGLPGHGGGGLHSPNLIRAHRGELLEASQGKLDHLVIEVVASLFDQILSDPQVPPQMARLIARLQLPVLRVALRDPAFFASRRHPVRRFINRVSSLGVAMDGFDAGPGQELLERVGTLIEEIVQGDFEQIEIYGEKLLELERFTADQARAEIKTSSAAETLRVKELEWRVLNRFSQQLAAALEPLTLATYLKEFLAQVWSQVILAAADRDGAESVAALRYRRAGYELAVSIQPKRSMDDRKYFLSTLPGLMDALKTGMALIEWPEANRNEFFGRLITDHAGSLKGGPVSDLDHNLLLRRLEAIFKMPIPGRDEAASAPLIPPYAASPGTPASAAGAIRPVVFEQRFSSEEASSLGLIGETAVDWAAPVDLPLPDLASNDELEAESATADATSGHDESQEDPAEPTEGPTLRDHLQVGFSYQLYLKDQWQKVRLTYMSPGRNFFLFTHGSQDRASISMTARMLERLCETRRMRAFETAFLVERATRRARKQLAALASVPAQPGQRA